MNPAVEHRSGSSPGTTSIGALSAPGEISAQLRAIVHELNNPLAVVMGFTQLMILSDGYDGRFRADLDKIYGEMKRVVKGVERLHAYALSLQACVAPVSEGGSANDSPQSLQPPG